MRVPASRALDQIRNGVIAPGYVLLGAEIYWRDEICEALRHAMDLDQGGAGLSELDLRQSSLDNVLENAQTHNLLSPRQLIIVKNAQALASRRMKESSAATQAEGFGAGRASKRSDALAAYFRDPNPAATLVFEMMDVDLESDDWRDREKATSRIEAFEGTCEVVLLLAPTFAQAMELVRRMAAERGRKISPQTAEQLVAGLHRNMALIRMEMEKLCLYHPEKDYIDTDDLNQIVASAAGETSIGLTDSIGARDVEKALRNLDDLKRSGRYAPLVVSEVVRFLRQLILIKENKARDARQAARILWEAKLGAPQSAVAGLLRHARNFTAAELLRGLELAFEADLALRSSPPDENLVLEKFILALTTQAGGRKTGVPA